MTGPKAAKLSYSLRLKDLSVLQNLAETRSTTASAARLGVTQSAVSQSVARLEKWVGTRLLDRSSRPIRLTLAGEILRRRANEILRNVERAAEEVVTGANAKLPILRVGMVDSFATTAGPEVVKSLQPRVEQLRVWSGISPLLSAELLNRSLDFIVSTDPMEEHSELSREQLLREPLVAAVPREAAERFRGLSIERMCEELPLVCYTGRSSMGQAVQYFLSQRRIAPQSTLEFDASEAVLRMVESDIGWAISTPLCLLQARAQLMNIAVLQLPSPQAYRSIYVVYRRNELSQVIAEIVDVCRTCVQTTIMPNLLRLAPWAFSEVASQL